MRRPGVVLTALFLVAAVLHGEAQAQRSFVGRKIPARDFRDLRGHTVNPKFYEGSVLVVFGGIPW